MRSPLRRSPFVAVLAAALVLAAGTLVAATRSRTPITEPVTLRLKAESLVDRDEDVSPLGPSLGDRQIRTSALLQGGEEVGHVASICTYTGVKPNEILCTLTFKLDQGQISVQALYRRSLLLHGADLNVAVVGGTGSYRNVRGAGTQTRISKRATRYVLKLAP